VGAKDVTIKGKITSGYGSGKVMGMLLNQTLYVPFRFNLGQIQDLCNDKMCLNSTGT